MDIQSIDSTVFRWLVWAFCVIGLSWALFESFAMKELMSRVGRPFAKSLNDMRRLQWEINRKREARPGDAGQPDDEMQAPKHLNASELEWRRAELRTLQRKTLWFRVLKYFSECRFCHLVWSAIIVYYAEKHVPAGVWFALAVAGLWALVVPSVIQIGGSRRSGCS